ncbi:MAG: PIG-L family deacetylase [Candidatus Berkelbacteria bacterium]|nr:PIG-L family deacetylase [Candidatus Berkelbacteria bacterium]MCR4306955.1 PIG-L family deacetylase [Candidatus Berkelbacteria bacterium]
MYNYWRTNWKKLILGLIVAAGIGLGLYLSGLDTLPQASFSLLGSINSPTSADRVLVIAPHQDDEVLGAGDYIQRAVSAGAKVEVVFATDGNKHGKKEIRHDEAVIADAKLGLTEDQLIFFDFPDGELSSKTEYDQFVVRLGDEIKNFQPTIVITTLIEDEHPDHAASGRAVQTLSTTVAKFTTLFFLIHSDRYPRPIGDASEKYLLPPLKLTDEYDWEVFVASTDEQTRKRAAINSYRSQISLANPILRQLLQSFDRRNELFAKAIL